MIKTWEISLRTSASLTDESLRCLFIQTAENFVQLADHKHQDTMKATYYGSFGENPTFVFDGIYNDDVRIVLGMFSEKYARSVLCQVSVDSQISKSQGKYMLLHYILCDVCILYFIHQTLPSYDEI